MTFNTKWTSQDLAWKVCEVLSISGVTKTEPGFIRTDLEAELAAVLSCIGLDGAKMQTIHSEQALGELVRQGMPGERWWLHAAVQVLLDMQASIATAGVIQSSPNPATEDNVRPSATIGVKTFSVSRSEMAMKLTLHQQFGSQKERILSKVQLRWPAPVTLAAPREYEYKLCRGDVELEDCDVLEEGDVITAVMTASEIADRQPAHSPGTIFGHPVSDDVAESIGPENKNRNENIITTPEGAGPLGLSTDRPDHVYTRDQEWHADPSQPMQNP